MDTTYKNFFDWYKKQPEDKIYKLEVTDGNNLELYEKIFNQ